MINPKDALDKPFFEELLNDYANYWDSTDYDGMERALGILKAHIRANFNPKEQDNERR